MKKTARRFIQDAENYRLFQLYMVEKSFGEPSKETTDSLGECMVKYIHIPGKAIPRAGIFTKFFKLCVAEYYKELRRKIEEQEKSNANTTDKTPEGTISPSTKDAR